MSSAAPSGSCATICLAAVTHAFPGPKILPTFGHAAGAVGHRGDRLRTAELEHLLDAAKPCRHEHGRVGGAVRARRRAHDAHGTPGDACRHRQHDRRGWQRGSPGRHVQSNRIERHDHAFADDTGRRLDTQRRERLRLVEARHGVDRTSQRGVLLRRSRPTARHRTRPRVTAKDSRAHLSKRCRVFTQRHVAARTNVIDDGSCALVQSLRRPAVPADATRLRGASRRAATSRGFPASRSCEHLFDRQHEYRAGARCLQAFQRFPEHGFAADRMDGDLVVGAVERDDRR